VQILDQVLPGCFDVRGVPIIGLEENLQADVIVAGRIGVLVEEL
jgi:hypothetical protein